MARLQVKAGAYGLTVAKVGEAEVLAQETTDILIAYPAIDPVRTRRLAELAHQLTVRVAVDSQVGLQALAEAAQAAGSTIGILVDLDVGFHRTGVQTPQAALELAQFVDSKTPSLRLDGLFFYPGHVWASAADQANELGQVDAKLREVISLWKAVGLQANIVSGGSTPAMLQSHLVTCQTETRPGTYIYNDMNTVRGNFCSLEDVAAAVVCTVVSTSVPGKAIVDGGTKTFTSDRNFPSPDSGFGYIVEYPHAKLARMSEEHGELEFEANSPRPRVGERVTIIPNHICPCVNLHDQGWGQHSDGALEPLPIDSRGRLT